MAFVVENGTGLANANSFASVAAWVAYAADRGISLAALATDADKEKKLVIATDYINNGFRFKGQKLTTTQALWFPATGIYDRAGSYVASDSVPLKIQYATFEFAYRAITSPLWNIPTYDTVGIVTAKRVKVGPIEEENAYTGGFSSKTNAYPPGDVLLADFLLNAGQSYNYR